MIGLSNSTLSARNMGKPAMLNAIQAVPLERLFRSLPKIHHRSLKVSLACGTRILGARIYLFVISWTKLEGPQLFNDFFQP